jgi:chemotaxis protein methyltransferase CheR
MAKRGISSTEDYLKLLRYDQNEFYDIVNFLTINETYFFREPFHLTLFSQRLFPELLNAKKIGIPVKILSAGCSTGEEPYSLAIALLEKYGMGLNKTLFSIIGADIDQDALHKAAEGVYSGRSFRSLSPYLKEKYFEPIGEQRFRVRSDVRDMVLFKFFNLMNTPYPEYLQGMDVIFYRNVSIYFDSEIQKKIFENLSQTLNDNGYLIVGSAETLSHTFDVLTLIEKEGVFLYQKQCKPHPRPLPEPERDEKAEPPPPSFSGKEIGESDQFDAALNLAKNKAYREAIEILDNLIKTNTDIVKAYTLKAGILINLQQAEEAKELCLKAIEKDSLCAEGYFLSGLIAKSEHRHDEALKRLKETVYLSPSSWPAHFYLAEIYQAVGEKTHAEREYGIVIRLLGKGYFKDHGLAFFPFSFSEEDIERLCRYHIGKLKSGR